MARLIQKFAAVSMFSLAVISACGGDDKKDKKADNNEDDGGTSPPTAGTVQIDGGFNTSIPKDLAIASVMTDQSAEAVEAGKIQVSLQSSGGEDYLSKRKRTLETMSGDDTKACLSAIPREFSLAQGNIGHAPCFGPSVTYTNHPDGIADGSIGNGDYGMYWKYSEPSATDGPGCATAVSNNLMNNVAAYGDMAIGFQSLVACAARIEDDQLPASGSEKDVLDDVKKVDLSGQDFTISEAKISTEGTEGEDNYYIVTKIKGTLTDVPRSLTKNFDIVVRHHPDDSKNSSYKGVYQFTIEDFEDGRDAIISLRYAWSNKDLKYRYRQVQVTQDTAFDSSTREVPDSAFDSGWAEVIVNTDEIGFGKLAFIWNTFDLLVFNAETKRGGTGAAYFGHRKAEDVDLSKLSSYDVQGLRCLPINPPPQGSEPYSSFVQSQTVKLNADSGSWDLDVSKITYAPTTTCSWDESIGENGASFDVSLDGASDSLSFPLEADLLPLADYQKEWTGIELPEALSK